MVKHQKRKLVETGAEEKIDYTTIKCSLSSLMRPIYRNEIEQLVLYCNQIRVLATLLVKYHYFTYIATLEDMDVLPFAINQNYFNRAFTLIRTGNINQQDRHDLIYADSLRTAYNRIRAIFNLSWPTYQGNVGASALSLICAGMAKVLADNATTHATTHAMDCLEKNWLRNQARADMSDADFDSNNAGKSIVFCPTRFLLSLFRFCP